MGTIGCHAIATGCSGDPFSSCQPLLGSARSIAALILSRSFARSSEPAAAPDVDLMIVGVLEPDRESPPLHRQHPHARSCLSHREWARTPSETRCPVCCLVLAVGSDIRVWSAASRRAPRQAARGGKPPAQPVVGSTTTVTPTWVVVSRSGVACTGCSRPHLVVSSLVTPAADCKSGLGTWTAGGREGRQHPRQRY
jgi:hypothetical protein